jgi:hypothetical protein
MKAENENCPDGYRVWKCAGGTIHLMLENLIFHFTDEEFCRMMNVCLEVWSDICRDCSAAVVSKCSGRIQLSTCCRKLWPPKTDSWKYNS